MQVGKQVSLLELPKKWKNERWRNMPVEGFEDVYAISDYGRIALLIGNVRRPAGSILNPYKYTPKRNGIKKYFMINLNYKGKKKLGNYVHRLVALAFIPTEDMTLTVNHMDGNGFNNFYKNLEWVTIIENNDHALANGLIDNRGTNHGFAKLNDNRVLEIRAKYASGKYSQRKLADEYGVHFTTIGQIVRREKWTHI